MKNKISHRNYTVIAFGVAIAATLAGMSETFGLKVWPTMHLVLWFPIVVICKISDFDVLIPIACVQFPLLAACFTIGIRRLSPLFMAVATTVFYALLVCVAFVTAYPDLRSQYHNFAKHDKKYYSEIAKGCDILLSFTNSTSDWWVLNGDDKSLPTALLDLNSTKINVAKHQPMGTNSLTAVIIVFGKGRPDFAVSWQQNHYENGYLPWELSVNADDEHTVVFATTNLSLLSTNSAN